MPSATDSSLPVQYPELFPLTTQTSTSDLLEIGLRLKDVRSKSLYRLLLL
jgi:hypothetical protein